MAKRDAIADVLGDESPILTSLAREATMLSSSQPPQPLAKEESRVETPRPSRPRKQATRRLQNRLPVTQSSKTKRLLVSSEEEDMIDDLSRRIGRRVGTKVQFSQVTRAMWALLLDTEDVMDRVSAPPLRRPANGSEDGMAEFEADLSNYLLDLFQAIKKQSR